MALRLALVIDGNADGAARAASEAQRGVRAVADAAEQSSRAVAAASQRTTASVVDMQQAVARFAGIREGASAGRAADIASYGRALDDLRAKYNPLFAAGREYKATLLEIAQATRVGAITEQEHAAAIERTKAAFASQVAVIRGIGGASRFAALQARQLSFQLIDIGQAIPLAFQSPLYALQNIGFQLAQIGQLYMGQGGLRQALADSVAQVGRFGRVLAPIAAPIAAITAGLVGMTYEINRSTDAQVGFGDVVLAVFQTARDAIANVLRPAINAIAPWFDAAWNAVIAGVKIVGNTIIGSFVAAFEDVKFVWSNFADIVGAATIGAVNAVIGGINTMIQKAVDVIDQLIAKANRLPGINIESFGQVTAISPVENPFAGRLGNALGARNAAVESALSRDYLGEFFQEVQSRAISNALGSVEEKAQSATRAVGGLGRAFGTFGDRLQTIRSGIGNFFSTLQQGLRAGENGWAALANAAISAIDSIVQRIAGSALDRLLGSLFGGVSAGFVGAGGVPIPGTNPFFGGFRAEGGPLSPGKWYIAGERGPEPVWGGGPGAFATGYGGGAARMGIDVRVFVEDDGRLGAIAQQAGSDAGRQAADLRVETFSKKELPDRMRDIGQHPRRRG